MFVIPMTRHHSAELSQRIERLFNVDPEARALRSPALDVTETDQAYRLQMDLPGIAKEAVKIRIEGRRVNIDAEQAQPAGLAEGERVLHRERSVTRFSRSIALPQELDQAASVAKLENGVLSLTLAKRVPAGAGQLNVE
ncbi:Hsp20/alpha crystallin family protein [Pelomonas sp. SE-A7]|uniref:Hsp20/alpha crystallin family protein n=1 Tax=Pelomonas sp. SE-A7 TaxID=3054953 RepID=UPI00259C6B7B|nr:Hsp20/alpha crystallin family protein [Pelomonas sp. SE-A7]MDM4765328.1 Hsp20/alpha crystallin family protein [Pelomonas sp. SE-A7]